MDVTINARRSQPGAIMIVTKAGELRSRGYRIEWFDKFVRHLWEVESREWGVESGE